MYARRVVVSRFENPKEVLITQSDLDLQPSIVSGWVNLPSYLASLYEDAHCSPFVYAHQTTQQRVCK
jgi:hypothetical protein